MQKEVEGAPMQARAERSVRAGAATRAALTPSLLAPRRP